MRKGYITLNYRTGWKVVFDVNNHVDCSKPIYNSNDLSNTGLNLCEQYCKNNKINIIRVCK